MFDFFSGEPEVALDPSEQGAPSDAEITSGTIDVSARQFERARDGGARGYEQSVGRSSAVVNCGQTERRSDGP
jgi:hypothetical protein